MNQLLYKSFLQKIAAILLGIMAVGNAPLLSGTGNGLISVAVFEDNTTHQLQYYEISDAQYALMTASVAGAEAYNPASTTAKYVRAFQYHAGDNSLDTSYTSATSSSKVVPNPIKNFKDNDNISLFNLVSQVPFIEHTYAAVAVDATTTSGNNTAASQTWAHTVTGSNTVLFVYGKARSTTATNLQLMTYNGVQMATTTSVASYNDGQWGWMMQLANPSTGTHNIVALFDSSISSVWDAASFTGAAQTGIPDSVASSAGDGSSSSFSMSTTVVANNSLLLMGNLNLDSGTCANGTGTTIIENDNPILSVSNSAVGAGSQSLALTSCGNRVENKIILSIAPFVAAATPLTSQDLIMFQE